MILGFGGRTLHEGLGEPGMLPEVIGACQGRSYVQNDSLVETHYSGNNLDSDS